MNIYMNCKKTENVFKLSFKKQNDSKRNKQII